MPPGRGTALTWIVFASRAVIGCGARASGYSSLRRLGRNRCGPAEHRANDLGDGIPNSCASSGYVQGTWNVTVIVNHVETLVALPSRDLRVGRASRWY
jgi:hypothetical protein